MPDTVPEASGDCGAHHAAHPRLATSSELNGAQGTASTAAATAPANGTASLAEYWRAVGDSLAQFDGIAHGYDRYCVQANSSFRPLTSMQMMLMQMDGDLPDVESAVDPTGESARLHGGSKLGRRGRAK